MGRGGRGEKSSRACGCESERATRLEKKKGKNGRELASARRGRIRDCQNAPSTADDGTKGKLGGVGEGGSKYLHKKKERGNFNYF